MRIFTRSRDATEYIKQLETMVVAMATDISDLLNTGGFIRHYTPEEIIKDYGFVTSEPSIFEEMIHKEYGTPYLDRESNLAYLVRTGVVVRDEYIKG